MMRSMMTTASTKPSSTATPMQGIPWAVQRPTGCWTCWNRTASSPRARKTAQWLTEEMEVRFGNHPLVGEIRHIGLIHALELVADKKTKAPFPAEKRLGYQFYRKALERGLVLRPLGDVLYFNPPLTITRGELTQAMDILEQVLE